MREGVVMLDSNGDKIIENFKRYFPNFSQQETWIAILFILVGMGLVILIDKYGTDRNNYIDE